MKTRSAKVLALAAALLLAGALADRAISFAQTAPSPTINPNITRWRWLEDTYWYVPNRNLPAVLYLTDERRSIPILDQTVYHITSYTDGYFTGDTVVQLGQGTPTCMSLLGSITPEGVVLLTFTPLEPTEDAAITQGTGKMRFEFGQWTMENQMTSGPGVPLLVAHWAYMLQTKPGDRSWNSLPGVGMSVPKFLGQCGFPVRPR